VAEFASESESEESSSPVLAFFFFFVFLLFLFVLIASDAFGSFFLEFLEPSERPEPELSLFERFRALPLLPHG